MRKKSDSLNCSEIEKLAQKYIDGYLSVEENKLFEQHLDYCLPCDKKIEFEKKLRAIVRLKAKNNSLDIQSHEKFKRLISSLE
jgi:hypothetical protein